MKERFKGTHFRNSIDLKKNFKITMLHLQITSGEAVVNGKVLNFDLIEPTVWADLGVLGVCSRSAGHRN